ncbi:MAG TPA: ACP S-malonyltransferase [bacterium]|nr:ACP S-malonyltransferase [bacterium]
MARIVAIFPNEGSQYVGMGKEFYAKSITVRDLFDKAEKLLQMKIAKICFLGPQEDQDILLHAHLITFLSDVAFFDPLVQNRRKPELLTGIGVGEVAALVAAESIPFANALQFIVRRAGLLRDFAEMNPGSGLFITGTPWDRLKPSLLREEGELIVTQALAPDTFVLWGPEEAVRSLESEVRGNRQIKTNPQPKRGPLFSEKAVELEKAMEALLVECLGDVRLKNPKIAFHRCWDGEYVGTPEAVREVLTCQYSKPVDWVTTVQKVNQRGFRTWVEVGPGKVYGSLVRKVDTDNRISNVEDVKSLSTTVKVTG